MQSISSIAALLTGQGQPRRKAPPIRRDSLPLGRVEKVWFRVVARIERRRIVLAARRYEVRHKEAGRRNGPLGYVALAVLELLANLVNPKTGRLDPSLTRIADLTGHSRSAVVEALNRLQSHGFVEKVRRWGYAKDKDGELRPKQASNAYRIGAPPAALALVKPYYTPAPQPDDDVQRRAQEAQERAQLAQRAAELEATGRDPWLARHLGRMLAAYESGGR